jgi:hypothetical protein
MVVVVVVGVAAMVATACGKSFVSGEAGSGGTAAMTAGSGGAIAGTSSGSATAGSGGSTSSSTGASTTTGAGGAGGAGGNNVPPCSPGNIDTFVDDFNNDTIAPDWTGYGDAARIEETSGVLYLHGADNKVARDDVYVWSTGSYDLRGCAVHVEIEERPVVHADVDWYLLVGIDGFSWLSIGVRGSNMYFVGQDAMTALGSSSVAYDTSDDWLRIREDGNVIYYDTSTDGMAWTERYQHPAPSWTNDVHVSLGLITFSAVPTPGFAQWDNLNL